MRVQISDTGSPQNPPCPPLRKGGKIIPPFDKGGLGGIFMYQMRNLRLVPQSRMDSASK